MRDAGACGVQCFANADRVEQTRIESILNGKNLKLKTPHQEQILLPDDKLSAKPLPEGQYRCREGESVRFP